MNNKLIKLHKGVDNSVSFRVFNRDRKPQNIENYALRVVIVDPRTNERVLDKYCEAGYELGMIKLDVREGELQDVTAGFYDMFLLGEEDLVHGQEGDIVGTPFYTDHNNEISIKIEIVQSAFSKPADTTEIDSWSQLLENYQNIDRLIHYSSAIPASRIKNHIDPHHTLAFYLDNYSGEIEVLGTLDHIPPTNLSEWFKLDVTSINETLEISNMSGILPITFQAQILWMRIKHIPVTGEITKVLIRS